MYIRVVVSPMTCMHIDIAIYRQVLHQKTKKKQKQKQNQILYMSCHATGIIDNTKNKENEFSQFSQVNILKSKANVRH